MNRTPEPSRRLHWISSTDGDPAALANLNERMSRFYSSASGDDLYRSMFAALDSMTPGSDSIRHLMPRHICDTRPATCLEIGCGNGRVYRQLREYGFAGKYTGIELSVAAIAANRAANPEATWEVAGAYDIPGPDGQFDCAFSVYVLEHLVYPERALREMMRVVRPGGRLIVVFPDFVASGRFGSQIIGLSPGRVGEKMKSGRWLDALLTAYDGRIRVPRALTTACRDFGPFPVNLNPAILTYPDCHSADVDAVYIGSKEEVRDWATRAGYQARFPAGVEGDCRLSAFIEITK